MLQTMRSAKFQKFFWSLLAIVFVGGFVFYESSGLWNGRAPVTTTTAVAEVNGETIPYLAYQQAAENAATQEQQRLGRQLTLDERQRLDNQTFDQLVTDVLLRQEYKRRGITVTDQELKDAARTSPPPQLLQAPELQTEGRFDPAKYVRYMSSPQAKQSGVFQYLEAYYRDEVPKEKLYSQIASTVYVTDSRLWAVWQDTHDSAQISFVAFRPAPDTTVAVSDAEVKAYYDAHKSDLELPGRAVVSVVHIPRVVTAADSAATRNRLLALRAEIAGGAKFADVAKRESTDSGSAQNGGLYANYVKGSGFVKPFEDVAFSLAPGELSQPVLTQFGYHLITVDSRKGDTVSLRHILLPIAQSDSSAAITDKKADELARRAAGADDPKKFDDAANALGLLVQRGTAIEGEPLTIGGGYVPSVSAWAFGGTAKPGSSSDLFDAPDGYYLARVDSLHAGGAATLEAATPDIKRELSRKKAIQLLVPQAQKFAAQAAGSTLESASQAVQAALIQTKMFSRVAPVPGIGQLTEVTGASFTLPVGTVSAPITTDNGVYVIRVDRRVPSNRAEFEAQKAQTREQVLNSVRQQRVRDYVEGLRRAAKIDDRRKRIAASVSGQTA